MSTFINGKKVKSMFVNGKRVKTLWKGGEKFFQEQMDIIPQDYILRYDFDGNTADKSANGLNGVLTGTINFIPGRKGKQCADFVNGYVNTVLTTGLRNYMTVSFWIKTGQKSLSMILEMGPNAYTTGNTFYLTLNELLLISNPSVYFNSDMKSDNMWEHIVLTIDRTNGNTVMYRNGVIFYNKNHGIKSPFSDYPIFIGARQGNIAPFVGQLQELKIYNRVLTEQEIQNIYNAEK